MPSVVLTEKEVGLLKQTRDLLEEILETLDIMADKKLMSAIREGEEDIKKGRVRDYHEFVRESGLRHGRRPGKSGRGTES